ncbi:RDD family protein [Nitratifractor sp.]
MAKVRFRDVKQGRAPREPVKRKRSAASPSPTPRDADIGDRMKAFLTDSFMILTPILYVVFYLIFGSREGFAAHRAQGWLYILVSYVAISATFVAASGQTPGMRYVRIRVVDRKSGRRIGVLRSYLRQALGVVDFLFFLWIVGFFRRDHRTPHEILTNTALVYDAPEEKAR